MKFTIEIPETKMNGFIDGEPASFDAGDLYEAIADAVGSIFVDFLIGGWDLQLDEGHCAICGSTIKNYGAKVAKHGPLADYCSQACFDAAVVPTDSSGRRNAMLELADADRKRCPDCGHVRYWHRPDGCSICIGRIRDGWQGPCAEAQAVASTDGENRES